MFKFKRMQINKEKILGRTYQVLLILISIGIIILSLDLKFIIISFLFFGVAGGGWEFITMNKFYAKGIKIKKENIRESIKYGLLWVHFNIDCIKRYGTKMYYFKKLGSFPTFVSYLTMTLYILTALLLYQTFSYYGLIIYIIPFLTNLYSFWKNNYYIIDSLKK